MTSLICFCKWCQHLKPEEIAALMKSLGFDGADLPVRPGDPLDHANGPTELPRWKRIFEDHGVRLERLVTLLTAADAEAERLIACCADLGIRKVRIADYSFNRLTDYRPVYDQARRNLKGLEALFAKHGVAGGIQNHSGTRLAVNISSLMRVVEVCDPRWIGIQYDPGHCTLSGEPPVCALTLMGPYCHSVNFKSPRQAPRIDPRTGHLVWQAAWVPLRDGMLDVPLVLGELKRAGYSDAISIHAEYRSYFHQVTSDLAATNKLVAEDVKFVRECLAALG